MKKNLLKATCLICVMLMSSCASSYKPIQPASLAYSVNNIGEDVSLSYRYDVISNRGNKKYAKKEYKTAIKVVAVRITNNTHEVMNIGRDYNFYSGENPVSPLMPFEIKMFVKQSTPIYLLYMLFTSMRFWVTTPRSYSEYPIGYALGPGLTAGNMLVANAANKNFWRELETYNVIGRDINPGETIYGIIGIRTFRYDPITLRKVKNN